MTLSSYDKARLDSMAKVLSKIKDDHLKDELLGAAKWAAVSSEAAIDTKLPNHQ